MSHDGMAEKLLEAVRVDYYALGRSMLTPEESALSKKREYWWNRAMAPHLKQKARHEKAMNRLVCPLCMDNKATRHRAHLGPFIKRGDGMIHNPADCPHQNGEIIKVVDKP